MCVCGFVLIYLQAFFLPPPPRPPPRRPRLSSLHAQLAATVVLTVVWESTFCREQLGGEGPFGEGPSRWFKFDRRGQVFPSRRVVFKTPAACTDHRYGDYEHQRARREGVASVYIYIYTKIVVNGGSEYKDL